MGILVDREILDHILRKEIIIDPFDDKLINPSSLDVRFANRWGVLKSLHPSGVIDVTDKSSFDYEIVERDEYIMLPNEFIIAQMLERIELPPYISAKLFGKSSLARVGIDNSSCGAWIDPGFPGSITLEIKNLTNHMQRLTAGAKCGQLIFERHNYASVPYNKRKESKYINQTELTGSRGI